MNVTCLFAYLLDKLVYDDDDDLSSPISREKDRETDLCVCSRQLGKKPNFELFGRRPTDGFLTFR